MKRKKLAKATDADKKFTADGKRYRVRYSDALKIFTITRARDDLSILAFDISEKGQAVHVVSALEGAFESGMEEMRGHLRHVLMCSDGTDSCESCARARKAVKL